MESQYITVEEYEENKKIAKEWGLPAPPYIEVIQLKKEKENET